MSRRCGSSATPRVAAAAQLAALPVAADAGGARPVPGPPALGLPDGLPGQTAGTVAAHPASAATDASSGVDTPRPRTAPQRSRSCSPSSTRSSACNGQARDPPAGRRAARREAAGGRAGLKQRPRITRHLVFTGNPGTGKTTVARLVGGIYAALGAAVTRPPRRGRPLRARRRLPRPDRDQDRRRSSRRPRGGVLFIDEAYSLVGDDQYGQESVDTLVKEMEDRPRRPRGHRGRLPRRRWRRSSRPNPGLASRFRTTIEFADYTDDELVAIFGLLVDGGRLRPRARALSSGSARCSPARRAASGFGNGRFVRNVLEAAIGHHAWRLRDVDRPHPRAAPPLLPEDLDEDPTTTADPAGPAVHPHAAPLRPCTDPRRRPRDDHGPHSRPRRVGPPDRPARPRPPTTAPPRLAARPAPRRPGREPTPGAACRSLGRLRRGHRRGRRLLVSATVGLVLLVRRRRPGARRRERRPARADPGPSRPTWCRPTPTPPTPSSSAGSSRPTSAPTTTEAIADAIRARRAGRPAPAGRRRTPSARSTRRSSPTRARSSRPGPNNRQALPIGAQYLRRAPAPTCAPTPCPLLAEPRSRPTTHAWRPRSSTARSAWRPWLTAAGLRRARRARGRAGLAGPPHPPLRQRAAGVRRRVVLVTLMVGSTVGLLAVTSDVDTTSATASTPPPSPRRRPGSPASTRSPTRASRSSPAARGPRSRRPGRPRPPR